MSYAEVGLRLIEQGYRIVPIRAGLKHPGYDGWNEDEITPARVRALSDSTEYTGWGAKNGATGGIDADIYDKDIAKALEPLMPKGALVRVGLFPKVMYLVNNPQHWRKRTSKAYIDGDGNVNKIEFQGEGQQSVVYGTHPDTGKPYWFHGRDILETPASALPVMSEDELSAIFAAFEQLAEAKVAAGEWRPKADRLNGSASPALDPLEAIVKASTPCNFTDAQVRADLEMLDPSCDRQTWVEVLAALHHQYQGSHDGLALGDEWSSKGLTYQGYDDVKTRWDSFSLRGDRNPVTWATMHERAKRVRAVEAQQQIATRTLAEYELDPNFQPMELERRDWIVPRRILRKFITLTNAPGGVSKSMFTLVTAVSLAVGRDLTGEGIKSTPRNVLIINNEDDRDELYRRLYGICLHYRVDWAEVCRRVFVVSGYLDGIIIAAENADGVIAMTEAGRKVREFIIAKSIDYAVFDPFVSVHRLNENDNVEMNAVLGVFKRIAFDGRCAIELIHHTRKVGGNSEAHAGDAEAGRGASSIKDAGRVSATLARMSRESAANLGLDWDTIGRHLVRLDTAKGNYQTADANARWYRLVSVALPNGDEVGVHEPFDLEPVIAEQDAANDAAQDEINQQYRLDIVHAIGASAAMRLSHVADNLQPVWRLRSRDAYRRRVASAVPDGRANAVPVRAENGARVYLWRETGAADNSPMILHLTDGQPVDN